MRKPVLILMMTAWLLAGGGAPLAAWSAEVGRPNVLLILADDLGFSDLGCYGGEIPTPNINRLAGEGARFSAFFNSARCCPSRASLMTGLHPHQAGIGSFTTERPQEGWGPAYTGHLLPSCVTLAELLGTAGYSTWMVGKWHLGTPGPIDRGFQNYFGFRNFQAHSENQWDPGKYARLPEGVPAELGYPAGAFYVTDVFADYALEFLRQARTRTDQPWLLYLAHSSPHFPIQAPRGSIDRNLPVYRRGWDVLRGERFERMKALGLVPADATLPPRSLVPVDRDDIANGYPGRPNPAWDTLPADRREDLAYRMATFAAMVEHVDAGVGRILKDLEAHHELDNTLIFFLSDNGACYEWGPFGFDGASRRGTTTLHTGDDLQKIGQAESHQSYGSAWANLGNTPLNLYKHFCHEGGIASPLIVHWPARVPGRPGWVTDPCHLMDIVPTICEAAGVTYPESFNGRPITPVEGISLLPALRGDALPERALAFEHQAARALRRGDWKVVWGKRMPTEPTWELYNLKTDRSEQHNLAAEHPELARRLAGEWEAWATRVGAEPFQNHGQGPLAATPATARPAPPTPAIQQSELTIACAFTPPSDHAAGVLVAQGGREQGYALHLVHGRPAFDVRIDGQVTRIIGERPLSGPATAEATLTRDAMVLAINGEVVARAASPGLIPVQPKDALSVGEDILTSAGDYAAPNRFAGEIREVRVDPRPASSTFAPKPLFADPNYHGPCDPEVVWNPEARAWWVFYTARRATRTSGTFVGTPIGVIASADLVHWRFLGYCSFDGVKGRPDMPDTHWAPGIIRHGDQFHMFATYKDNANPPWGGKGVIRHYMAPADDLLDGWKLAGVPAFTQPDPIDAGLAKVDDTVHAYYRVGGSGGIHWATSRDLVHWDNQGPCPGDVNAPATVRGFGYQEAPYVFRFGEFYWMLTDPHQGLAVYRSPDAVAWTLQGRILEEPGTDPQDATFARHPSVAVVDHRAFLFYHVEPNRPYPSPPAEQRTVDQKRSFLQVAELRVEDGRLTCKRDQPVAS